MSTQWLDLVSGRVVRKIWTSLLYYAILEMLRGCRDRTHLPRPERMQVVAGTVEQDTICKRGSFLKDWASQLDRVESYKTLKRASRAMA